MAKFSEINPNTKKVWRLQELHDAYSDSQKQLHHVQGLAKSNLEYSWNTICKQAQTLIIARAKADTKTITKEISQEFQNAFITTRSVYSKPSLEITAK